MTQNKKPVIGITGITGSGASTVAELLGEYGGMVISADRFVHDSMKKGQAAYAEIVGAFGASVLQSDGEIDRKALGAIVFGDENRENRKKLEAIVHPAVLAKIREAVLQSDCGFAVIDAPLLIESGLHLECDQVWFVIANEETSLRRTMERDGIDRQAAEKRRKSRQDESELAKYADTVIANNGDLDDLREQVKQASLGFFNDF